MYCGNGACWWRLVDGAVGSDLTTLKWMVIQIHTDQTHTVCPITPNWTAAFSAQSFPKPEQLVNIPHFRL
jgi:hypothetical protein